MVLADLRFGLVLSESLCGVRMLIVDHCFLCNLCVPYIGVLDSAGLSYVPFITCFAC